MLDSLFKASVEDEDGLNSFDEASVENVLESLVEDPNEDTLDSFGSSGR